MELPEVIREGAAVLKKNLILVVPTIIVAFVALSLTLSTTRVSGTKEVAGLTGFVSMILKLFAHGMTMAMAREALEKGTTSLSTGVNSAVRYFMSFLIAAILTGVIIGIGSALFIIPGLIAAFLLLFTFPSIVVDGAGPFRAMKRSFDVVRSRLRDSVMLFMVVLIAGFLFGIAAKIASVIPVLGQIVGIMLSGVFGGYISVVVVKAYIILGGRTTRFPSELETTRPD